MFYTKCFLWNVYLTWLVSDSVWTLVSYLSFVSSPFSHRSVQVHVHDFCSELIPYHKLYCDYSFQTIMLRNCVKLTKTKEIISADGRRTVPREILLPSLVAKTSSMRQTERREEKKGIVSFKILLVHSDIAHLQSHK